MVKLVNKNNSVTGSDFQLHTSALQICLVLLCTFIYTHARANEWSYTVQSQDNIWKIAEKYSAQQTELLHSEVLQAKVGIKAQGVERSVVKNESIAVKKNQPPAESRKRLPAPDLSAVPDISYDFPFLLSWPDLTGAIKYRLQIASNEQFGVPLIDTITDISELYLNVLPDGDYVLRIRGIDEMGFEGSNAVHEFTLNLKPAAPIPLNPQHWRVNTNTPIKFWWTIPNNINRYHFQLASDKNLGL